MLTRRAGVGAVQAPGARGGRSALGFTMIELMAVTAIGMLTIVAATMTLRNLFRAELRSAARRTSAAMRFAADRATLTGMTVRLVFDLDKGEIWAEATEDRVTLAASDEGSEDQKRASKKNQRKKKPAAGLSMFGLGGSGKEGEGEAETRPGIDARALTEDWEKDLEPPEKPIPSFEKLKGPGAKRIKLGSGIKIAAVITPRMTDPIEKGKAQVYFFPQGRAEPAIVHFLYKEDDYYTVVMHPLSGKAAVYPCYYQIPSNFGVSDDKRRRSSGTDACARQGGI